MTLRRQAFSGVRWTTASSLGRTFLQIAQISILARLLTPADFGLVALVTSIMVFLQIFADAGISNAIIHHQDISQKQLSSLYWLNVGVSAGLALLIAAFAPLVAAWYKQPQINVLLLMAGGTMLIGACAQQLRMVARKKLQFALLAKTELWSAVIGFVVASVTAYKGFGVYSILFGSLVSATAGSVLVWWWLSEGWRPQFYFSFREIRHFLVFGAYMIGNNLANAFNSQIDIMLGGKLLGLQAIGLYSMPRDLNLRIAGVINPIVTNVGLPVMAKAQSDRALLKNVYLQTMRMTASANFPVYVFLALFASPIVHILLGPKWEEAIPLLQIFAVWGLLRSTGSPIGSLLMACGRADLSFKWNIALLVIIPPFIYLGSYYGVTGMALAMTGIILLLFWPNWYFQVYPLCGARFSEYSYELAVPLALSIVSNILSFWGVYFLPNDLLQLLFGLLVSMILYVMLSVRFNRTWMRAMSELTGLS